MHRAQLYCDVNLPAESFMQLHHDANITSESFSYTMALTCQQIASVTPFILSTAENFNYIMMLTYLQRASESNDLLYLWSMITTS